MVWCCLTVCSQLWQQRLPSKDPSAILYCPALTAAIDDEMSGAPLPNARKVTACTEQYGVALSDTDTACLLYRRLYVTLVLTSSKPWRQAKLLRKLRQDRAKEALSSASQYSKEQQQEEDTCYL